MWSTDIITRRTMPIGLGDMNTGTVIGLMEVRMNPLTGTMQNTFARIGSRIDGTIKSLPRHRDVVKYLVNTYPVTRTIAKRFLENLNAVVIDNLMNQYSDTILSTKKNQLIRRYLLKKLELLNEILNAEVDSSVIE